MIRKYNELEINSADIEVNVQDVENLLTAIKNVDGIKKITDPVAVTIGGTTNVAQETGGNLDAILLQLVSVAGNTANTVTELLNIISAGGIKKITDPVAVTNALIDVALSTLGTEATLSAILTQLDVALSTRATEATLASILSRLDVALSTRATENTLSNIYSAVATEATLALIKAKTDNIPLDPAKESGKLSDIETRISGGLDSNQINIGTTAYEIQRANFTLNATSGDIIPASVGNKAYIIGMKINCQTDDATFKMTEDGVGDLFNADLMKKGGGYIIPANKILYKTANTNKKVTGTTTVGLVVGTIFYVYAP